MSQIIPFLCFDGQAEEAANFYVSVFNDSRIDNISRYGEAGPGPQGSAMVVEFQLNGQDVMALNGMVPAGSQGQAPIALFVSCDTQDEVDNLWDKLSAGGAKLQCGWLKDKYGIPWNIVPQGLGELLGCRERRLCGRPRPCIARDADHARDGETRHQRVTARLRRRRSLSEFNGQDVMALNGMVPAGSQGQAPIALFVSCDTQDEVDNLWDKLSAGGAKLQCGWLKDKYGIPWNIVPQGLGELLGSDDRDRAQRAMQTMLEMEKLDINELRRAYDGAAR